MSRQAKPVTRPARLGRIARLLFAGVSALALGAAAQADDRHAAMMVGASVQGIARVVDPGAPVRLVIGADDVAAGYVEVRPERALRVDSNSREGVAIEIRSRHPTFADVAVLYGSGIALLAGDTVRLVQRGRTTATLPLTYRFTLPQGLPAGSYDWPLEIHASAL